MDNTNPKSKFGSLILRFLAFLAKIFGFNKLTQDEKQCLHISNIKSSSYMAFIIIMLELWLIARQTRKYIIPLINSGEDPFKTVFLYCSIFILFIIISVGVMLFCLFSISEKKFTKGRFITLTVSGAICTLWVIMLKFEYFRTGDSLKAILMNTLVIIMYICTALLGLVIIAYAVTRYKNKEPIKLLEHLIIILFSMICLAFGVRVSYNDYIGGKEIICFLTMAIYVGCLLIYRPYISLLMLGVYFIGFLKIVQTFEEEGVANFFIQGEGDYINYITFLVSLCTICFTMYYGRLSEARKEKVLGTLAKYDEITNLPNFKYFTDKARKKLLEKEEYDNYYFLFINVRNFKAYNEKRGFVSGNELLKEIGDEVAKVFMGDLVARQADDHFVVLTDAYYLEKLHDLNEKLFNADKEILLGIYCGGYNVINNLEDPRRCVDKARYASKVIRNNFDELYIEYDKNMDGEYRKKQYIINNIDNAIENGWVKPYYQPLVWSENYEFCGCEALARWFDPKYGQLFPSEFIDILEDNKLIHKLDKYIFTEVCKDLRGALDEGRKVVPISINFSRLDFELMDAVGEFEKVVVQYNIPRELIHIEITESALVDSLKNIQSAINTFKNKGYSIWLDDFGRGYSSLNVLKNYDFDVIKVDMNFLNNFATNKKARTIINSIIRMASDLNMATVTEGVETSEEAKFLKEAGCVRLQGYLFGKPISKEELFDKVRKGELKISDKIF